MPIPPRDENVEPASSPYGPASGTPGDPEEVPPIEQQETSVPPIEAATAAAPSPATPPPAPAPQPGHIPPPAYGVPVPPPYQSAPFAPPRPSSTLSMLSMIFGIISVPLVCCWGFGFLFAVAGIVLGHLGRSKETAGGMALTGLILSYIVVGFSLLAFVALVGIGLIGSLNR